MSGELNEAIVKVQIEFRVRKCRFWLWKVYTEILICLAHLVPSAVDFLYFCGIDALYRLRPVEYRQGENQPWLALELE